MNDDNGHDKEDKEKTSAEIENKSDYGKVHSYLPGTCQPLYPDDVRMALSKNDRKVAELEANYNISNGVIELAVLMVDSMVAFPGSTVPLRLRSRKWVEYLRQRIDLARECVLKNVCIGVLTKNDRHDDLIGEICTLSVITHTHESEMESSEVVVTALGSRRFRLVSRSISSNRDVLLLFCPRRISCHPITSNGHSNDRWQITVSWEQHHRYRLSRGNSSGHGATCIKLTISSNPAHSTKVFVR